MSWLNQQNNKDVVRSCVAICGFFIFVCFTSVFACSCRADGAEQEESAFVCEYVLQFAVKFETSFSF